MLETQPATGAGSGTKQLLIDCDLHNEVPNKEALFPYLPAYWVEHMQQTLFKGPSTQYYPQGSPVAARLGSKPTDGPAGSSLKLLQEQVLDPLGVDFGILNCLYPTDDLHNPDAAIAMSRAVNDWQIEHWLEKDSRLRASIVIPSKLPAEAAKEIDRVGSHPGFVQVVMPVRTPQPLGNRNYLPMWEAIARNNLVAGIHFGGIPGVPPTPQGWSSYFYEEYAGMAQVFATQVTNIVSEGVFDHFPAMRVVLLESGFTWLPAHMWRFDKEWKNLRRLIPWVRKAPSEYIREHIRISVMPVDAYPEPRQLVETVHQLGSEEMLLFATDYPHRHTADAEQDLLRHLSPDLARKIRGENARALYGL
ncbi:MAG: amidohydrolase family protein [Chloroflexota bacterium]